MTMQPEQQHYPALRKQMTIITNALNGFAAA